MPFIYVRAHLEAMWDVGYKDGNPFLGKLEDVESAAEWQLSGRKPGEWFEAVAGEFIDDLGDGTYQIHDLFDHAPEYVKKRKLRHEQRKNNNLRHKTADNGGQRRTLAENGKPPAPAPTPYVSTRISKPSTVCPADAGAEVPPSPKPPRKQPTGLYHDFIRYFCLKWGEKYQREYDFGSKGQANGEAVKKILANPNVKSDSARAKAVVDRYLRCDDDQLISKQNHPILMLLNQINRFTGEPPKRADFVEDN